MWLGSFPCHASLLAHVRARLGEGGGLGAGGADDAHPGSVSNQITSGRGVQVERHQEYVQNEQQQKKIGTDKHKSNDKTGICTSWNL